uniref:hypothetical protein n=1 Tax=Methylocaldum sp. GT1BB TaxID=3438963 RepID=UPI003F748617
MDLGITRIPTNFNCKNFSDQSVKHIQRRYHKLRKALQAKGTQSAKQRHLRKIWRRRSRFQRDVNHVIAKRLVENAKDTRRSRTPVPKSNRAKHSG